MNRLPTILLRLLIPLFILNWNALPVRAAEISDQPPASQNSGSQNSSSSENNSGNKDKTDSPIVKPAPLPVPSCPIQKEVETLNKILREPRADYLAQIQAELDLRKTILAKTIDCATSETRGLRSSLADKKIDDPGLVKLQAELIRELDRVLARYESQKNMVKEVGLKSSREVALSVREWRSSTYGPSAQVASNLLIWLRNDGLLATAEERAKQISQTVDFLKLKDNQTISAGLSEAKSALAASRTEHSRAKDLLLSRSEETLPRLKISLEKLSEAYSGFLEISESVSKLLKP